MSFLQTHDQVGNRAFGDRISELADPVLLRAAYACLLLSPHAPMLFMGEEYGASTPFLYFCDFGPELAAAVSEGRRAEFGGFAAFKDEAARASIPDPNAESTFLASKLKWDERLDGAHATLLAHVRALLAVRRDKLMPRLAAHRTGGRHWREGEALRVSWEVGGAVPGTRAQLHLLAHFGASPITAPAPAGETIYATGTERDGATACRLAPGGVCLTLEENPLA